MNIYEYEACLADHSKAINAIRLKMIAFTSEFLSIALSHKCRNIDDLFDATNTHIKFPKEFEYRIDALDQLSFYLTMTKDSIKERYKIAGRVETYPPITYYSYAQTEISWYSLWLGNEIGGPA